MTFTDPIVAGSELVIDRINSTDYAPGAAGWAISRDGTAEFNNATLRGSLHVGIGYPVETFGGSIPAELVFDPLGFDMLGVVWRIQISADLELVRCYSDTSGGGGFPPRLVVWEAAINRTMANPVTWTSEEHLADGLTVSEPSYRKRYGTDTPPSDPGDISTVYSRGQLWIGNDTTTAGSQSPAKSPFFIDGISAARGTRMRTSSNVNSAAIGAEAVVLTATRPFFKFWDGRAYEARWRTRLQASVANTTTLRVRRTNAAGQLLGDWVYPVPTAAQDYQGRMVFVRAAGAGDLVSDIALTLTASAGTTTAVATGAALRDLEVIDIGADTDYPGVVAIV